MAKSTKSLSGAAKDAYLERAIAAQSETRTGKRISSKLKGEVTRVWVKVEALDQVARDIPSDVETPDAEAQADDFNPYEPNVIVVLRTAGRDRLLSALRDISTVDRLRRLAQEQQLGVEADVADPEALRLAIIAAAERRVANRRAAAS